MEKVYMQITSGRGPAECCRVVALVLEKILKQAAAKGAQLRVYSDKYLQNAAYVRLKDITLGYTLPKTLCSKIGFSSIRVYVSGTNLLTFSPLYKHNEDRTVDPEQLGDGNAYPFSKTFAFGFDFKF